MSQDTTYFKGYDESTKDPKSASHFGVMTYDKTDNLKAVYTEYFISGELKKHIPYSNYTKKIIDGKTQIWREVGILKEEINYSNDQYHGEYKTYWKNGKLKRNDFYQNDSLISGKCYDSSGNEIPYMKIQSEPVYPGGLDSLYSFLKRNMNYPDSAKEKGIQGKVYVQFIIDREGKVTDVQILKGIGGGCDEEAVRVIKLMPNWIPGKQDGEPVKVRYKLPITFRYEKVSRSKKEKKKKR